MQVRVCSLRSETFQKDFLDSLQNTGFAVLTHHGIDQAFIRETQQLWRLFFLSPQMEKRSFINEVDPNMGFKAMKSEKALGASVADLKEFYHWKPGQKLPSNVWAVTQHMFYQLEDISSRILSVVDKAENTHYEEACFQSDNTIVRTLYYPSMNELKVEPGAVRAAAHEDVNFLTLLIAASAPGLQVRDLEGKWHDVPHEENSIVVNVGDMLQLASKGKYRSTTHRVVNPNNDISDRISMPLFVHPKGNTLLSDGITAKQFLDKRLGEIYQKV